MSFLSERDKQDVRTFLNQMSNQVELLIFSSEQNCRYCDDTKLLVEELSELSGKIILKEYDMNKNKTVAAEFRIDKTPAIVIKAGKDGGIRFYGIPSGYEFNSLIEDVVDIANSYHGFSELQMRKIMAINKPVHLQVFVTPTCPYCPAAVRNAHRLAMAHTLITADMIEASEFPTLVSKYRVKGVPRTVVNEQYNIDGGLPEDVFIHQISEHLDNQSGARA